MRDAIDETVRASVEGICAADAGWLRAAFHPRASITDTMNGEFEWMPVEDFFGLCIAHGPEAGPPVWRLVAAEVAGDTAVVRVEDVCVGLRFTDLLTFVRFPEGWRIVLQGVLRCGTGLTRPLRACGHTAPAHRPAAAGRGRVAHGGRRHRRA